MEEGNSNIITFLFIKRILFLFFPPLTKKESIFLFFLSPEKNKRKEREEGTVKDKSESRFGNEFRFVAC